MENIDNEKAKINKILNVRETQEDEKSIVIANGIIIGGTVTFIMACIIGGTEFIRGDLFYIFIFGFIAIESLTILYICKKKTLVNKKYKEIVMPDIIENIIGDCYYDKDKFIAKELYYESGLYGKKDRTDYTGSDYIKYDRNKIKTVASKLKVTYITGDGRSAIKHTQFKGEYFINIFEKKLKYEKISVEFNGKISMLDRIKKFILMNIVLITLVGIPSILTVVKFGIITLIIGMFLISFFNYHMYMEMRNLDILKKYGERYGEEFSNLFLMQGSYIIGDKILTNDLIKILIDFKKKLGIKISISIRNNIVYIVFGTRRDLFNTKIFNNNKKSMRRITI